MAQTLDGCRPLESRLVGARAHWAFHHSRTAGSTPPMRTQRTLRQVSMPRAGWGRARPAGHELRRLVSSREAVWLAVVVALSAVGLVIATHTSFFYADDVDILRQANKGLSLKLIELSYFGHFAPAHRVLDWLVVQTGAHYAVALAIIFGFWLLAVLAFYVIVRAIAGL